jgi:hypothetical protein
MKFIGTPGDDDLVGTSGDDQFNMTQGGNDTVDGGAGNDIFSFGATFNLNDKLEGGTGNDTLVLSGDYSGGLYMSPTVLHGVEKIQVQVGHSYDLGFYDGVIDHGSSLTVNATGLAVTDSVYVDGGFLTSASADTKLVVDVGAGPARFVPGPGVNVFHGGSGQAIVYFAGQFNSSDQMDGGTSNVSEINLNGDYSTGLIITATMMHNFSELAVENGFNYNLTTADACVAAGQQLAVNAYALGAGSSLTFNGSHETDGGFNFTDGAGNDVLTGGPSTISFTWCVVVPIRYPLAGATTGSNLTIH